MKIETLAGLFSGDLAFFPVEIRGRGQISTQTGAIA